MDGIVLQPCLLRYQCYLTMFDVQKQITGFIFAAGFGTRLRPLTNSVPKPLVIVRGKPLLEYGLEYLRDLGVSQVYVNVHHLREQFDPYRQYRGLDIHILEEQEILGQAGALKLAESRIRTPYILTLNGDTILRVTKKKLLEEISKLEKLPDRYKLSILTFESTKNPLSFDINGELVSIGDRVLTRNGITKRGDAAGMHIISKDCIKLIPAGEFTGFYGIDDLAERVINAKGTITSFSDGRMVRHEITTLQDLREANSLDIN